MYRWPARGGLARAGTLERASGSCSYADRLPPLRARPLQAASRASFLVRPQAPSAVHTVAPNPEHAGVVRPRSTNRAPAARNRQTVHSPVKSITRSQSLLLGAPPPFAAPLARRARRPVSLLHGVCTQATMRGAYAHF